MKLIHIKRVYSVVAASAVFFGALSVEAVGQSAGAGSQPVAAGQGLIFDAEVDVGAGAIRSFAFQCSQAADGTVSGTCNLLQVSGNHIQFNVTSYDFDSDGNLILAGPVTNIDSPGSGANPPIVGWTALVSVRDDDTGTGDALTTLFAVGPVQTDGAGQAIPVTTLAEVYGWLGSYGLPYGPDTLYLAGLLSTNYQLISAGNISVF